MPSRSRRRAAVRASRAAAPTRRRNNRCPATSDVMTGSPTSDGRPVTEALLAAVEAKPEWARVGRCSSDRQRARPARSRASALVTGRLGAGSLDLRSDGFERFLASARRCSHVNDESINATAAASCWTDRAPPISRAPRHARATRPHPAPSTSSLAGAPTASSTASASATRMTARSDRQELTSRSRRPARLRWRRWLLTRPTGFDELVKGQRNS
jgi:hypothetical protein